MRRLSGRSQISTVRLSPVRAGLLLLAMAYGLICAARPSEYHFIDGVNLIAHEAGHLLGGYLGEFAGILSGTLGQLFIPAALTAYFLSQGSCFSASITLFWFGQNFFNISVYVRDAQAMALPLVSVGGGDAVHDWHYLLSRCGFLQQDQTVGTLVYLAGVATVVCSLVLGFRFSFTSQDSPSD